MTEQMNANRKSSLIRRILCGLLAVMLTSCSADRFYESVQTGTIINAPIVQWTSPNQFVLVERPDAPFEFHRFNGEVIRPKSIYTDGGSIPQTFWNRDGYSPWTYAPAYLVHDWLYEAHRRGKKPGGYAQDGTPLYYDKEKSDLILAEVLKTQMEDAKLKAKGDPSRFRLYAIYTSVQRFGDSAYNGTSRPVEQPSVLAGFSNVVESVIPDVVRTPLNSLRLQAQPISGQPDERAGNRNPE